MWAIDVLHHLCLNTVPPLSSFLPSTPSSKKFTCLCVIPFLQSLHYPLLPICNIAPVYWQVCMRRLWGSMMMYLRFIDRGCSVVVSISIYWGHKHPLAFYTGIAVTEGIDYVGSEIFIAIEKFCLESGYLLSACCFPISTLFLYPIPSFPTSACMCAQNS